MIIDNDWFALHTAADSNDTFISLESRGLAYGDGFFTTMAVSDGLILWSDYHQQRLSSHAHALQLTIDSQDLMASLHAHGKQLQHGIMKLIVTRAPQSVRGYGFTDDKSACQIWLKLTAPINKPQYLILPNGKQSVVQPASTALCLTSQIACLPPPLAGLKTLNRLDSVLASGELQCLKTLYNKDSQPIGEGLLRDMTGHWVEGTMSNVFYQLAGNNPLDIARTVSNPILNVHEINSHYLTSAQWYTPSMSHSGVAGVMRQVLIDALAITDKPVILRPLTDNDLPHLSQLFFCNAVRGIVPVSELRLLDGKAVALSV